MPTPVYDGQNGYRQSSGAGWRVVRPVEGLGLRQALPEHHLHPAARHATPETGRYAAHAGEH